MADADIAAARELQTALQTMGTRSEVNGSLLTIPELQLQVGVTVTLARDGIGATVVYDLSAASDNRDPVQVLAVGYGETPAKAFREAAVQWTTGVYTVVRHWLLPDEHTCLAETIHMVIRADDTGEEFGWRVHLGPTLSRVYGADPTREETFGTREIFKAIFNDLQEWSAHRKLFWVEAFVVRHEDGKLASTCRLRNQDWDEGEAALRNWATSWSARPKATVSARQFLLFEPIADSPANRQ